MPDRMHIRDLEVDCIIGTMPKERTNRQTVRVNLTLECDIAPAGRSDRLEDAVNYRTLKDRLVAFIAGSQFFLLERLAEQLAAMCLEDPRVRAVDVTVDKPGALTSARSVAVEIRRERADN